MNHRFRIFLTLAFLLTLAPALSAKDAPAQKLPSMAEAKGIVERNMRVTLEICKMAIIGITYRRR